MEVRQLLVVTLDLLTDQAAASKEAAFCTANYKFGVPES